MKKNILFLINILIPSSLQSFKTHVLLEKFFHDEDVSTEFSVYQQIKNQPLDISTNYVAVPWAALINQNKLHLIPHIKIDGGFTVCQHIRYEKIIPLLKRIGIDTLFTPHVNKKYHDITVLPFPHMAINGPEYRENEKKDLLVSFIGFNTHYTRTQLFKNKLYIENQTPAVIKQRKKWHFELPPKIQIKNKTEYQEVLKRSRFSLCPRGTGASTIRFWESLKAGAIPILIADQMQLPPSFDWKSCIIKIPEKDCLTFLHKIKKINVNQEKKMRENCVKAYDYFLKNDISQCIKDYYKKG